MFSYPLLGDIETAWSKIKKKEPTAADFLRVFSLIQEPITSVPTETLLRYYGYTQTEKKHTIPSSGLPGGVMPGMPSLKMENIMNTKMPSLKLQDII